MVIDFATTDGGKYLNTNNQNLNNQNVMAMSLFAQLFDLSELLKIVNTLEGWDE